MRWRRLGTVAVAVGLVVVVMGWLWAVQAAAPERPATEQAALAGWVRNVELVGQIGGPARAVACAGGYAYVLTGAQLVVLDLSDVANPVRVAAMEVTGRNGRDLVVVGDYAYIAADDDGLRVVDIGDPTQPVEVGWLEEDVYLAYSLTVAEGYAYVADRTDRLRIVDVSDPTSPALVGTFRPSINDYVQRVAVTAGPGPVYAYVSYSNRMWVVDVTDRANPVELGNYAGKTRGVAVAGGVVYVAASEEGLLAIDVSEPLTPTLLDSLTVPGSAAEVVLSGTQAYVGNSLGGLQVADVSDPENLAEDGWLATPEGAYDVALAGHQALVANGERGLRVVDVSNPAAPVEVGAYDVPSAAWSLAVSGTHAYVGDYYYDPGAARGALRVVDVADPSQPVQVGLAELSDRATGLALGQGYAFVSAYREGLLVADVSNPLAPSEVISHPTSHLSHDVALGSSYAYLAESRGLYVFDVSVPESPVQAAFWPAPGGGISRVSVEGDTAYVGAGRDGLHLLDVSEPLTPTVTGVYTVDDFIYDLALHGETAYVAADALGLLMVDVSDPVSPTLAGQWNGLTYVQGVAVHERTSGQVLAWVLGEYWGDPEYGQGLAVVDVTDPVHPMELGLYDLMTEAQSVVVAEAATGQAYAYVAGQSGGLAIFRLRIRVYLPLVVAQQGP